MPAQPKNLCILGSTGSIGETTLRIVRASPDKFRPLVLVARASGERLLEQAREFRPQVCVLTDQAAAVQHCSSFNELGIELIVEEEALPFVVGLSEVDTVVCAMSGAVGLSSLEAAILARKEVLFANKEALVVGGDYIMQLAANSGVRLVPIDSEHSAICQCLLAGRPEEVAAVTLTASGGPFLNSALEEIAGATKEQVLAHPTWNMGPEVTVNSATMMNKALEVIEAHFLFGLPPEKIRVVIHPQSIVHGFVEFVDGSLFAQLSVPDMALAVQYALSQPARLPGVVAPLDLASGGQLAFQAWDAERFPLLALGYDALSGEWWEPVALNAINETAVRAFLDDEITFAALTKTVRAGFERRYKAGDRMGALENKPTTLHEILEADRMFRAFAADLIRQS